MTRTRAADDFATIRARMEELRRERETGQAAECELQRAPQTYRARDVRWRASEISTGCPAPRPAQQAPASRAADSGQRGPLTLLRPCSWRNPYGLAKNPRHDLGELL